MHSERAEHIDLHDTSHMLPAVDDSINSDTIDAIAPFLEIPTSILPPHDWKVLHSAPIKFKEHITNTEGRALLWSACHQLRNLKNHGKRNLFLVDNMSLCLAINRGRSSAPALKLITRQFGALSLATGARLVTRWSRSETNIADGPSRGLRYALGCKQHRNAREPPWAGDTSCDS